VKDGVEKELLKGHTGPVQCLAFHPRSRLLASGSWDKTIRLWDLAKGERVDTRVGHADHVRSLAFDARGGQLASGSLDRTVKLWQIAKGRAKELHTWKGHTKAVKSVAFESKGGTLLSGSDDGTVRIWGVDKPRDVALGSMTSFSDATWAVIDAESRYDASQGGLMTRLHWVVATEPIALGQLKDRYYEPRLLGKLLGLNREPVRKVDAFQAPGLYPELRAVKDPTAKEPILTVKLANRGGGLGRLVVSINGKEFSADARGGSVD